MVEKFVQVAGWIRFDGLFAAPKVSALEKSLAVAVKCLRPHSMASKEVFHRGSCRASFFNECDE